MYDTKWSDEYLKSTGYKPNGSTEHDHLCRCPGCEGNDPPEDQQVMRAIDTAVDPDGLDKEGQEAWNELQRPEAIEPLCEGCHRVEEMCICGGVPDEPVPGWPPSAQETVYYQQIMAKPDEF